MELRPGDNVGEYEVLETIGNGGFSVVYKAEDTNLQRSVAIKQFSPEVFSEASTREWFIREARLSASLNHPNIVATYALREKGEELFLILEYLPGGDLHTLIEQNGALDRNALLKVAQDVCHALETLHARNVIHRDIKPENILIAEEGQFKLADFGLAHIRHHTQQLMNDASGPQPGTLLYMSPEQALGQEVTIRSDVYSLAVVLYEAMTAHYYLDFDYTTQNEDHLLDLILNAEPIPITRHHATVPDELAEPLLRALSKDPGDRPANAREFLSEIKNAFSRSKRTTLSKARRQLDKEAPTISSDLLRELYAVRTLRDLEHQPVAAQHQMEHIWQTASGAPEVSAEWGETLIALGRIDEGRDWLERSIRMKHDLPFAHLALADIYRNVDENDDEADDALIEAIHIDPDTVYAMLYDDIIDALTDAEAFETFNALFRRAAEEKPIAPIFHNWGQVLALNPDYGRESIRAFEAAIELDPDYGPAYVGLGSLLVQLERLQRAIPILEQATYRMYPFLTATDWHKTATVYQRSHAHLALAVAYAQAHQYENSAIAACTVLELAPKELEEDAPELLTAYVEAANAWMKKGENLRAYKFLNQIIPLAAYWGKVQIFTLLGIAQNKIPAEHRREQQWDDAEDWLKASLVDLQQNSDEDH